MTKTKVFSGVISTPEGKVLSEGEFKISLSQKTKSYFLKFSQFTSRGIAVESFRKEGEDMIAVFTEKGLKFSSMQEVKISNYSFVRYEAIERKATPKKVATAPKFLSKEDRESLNIVVMAMNKRSLSKEEKENIQKYLKLFLDKY